MLANIVLFRVCTDTVFVPCPNLDNDKVSSHLPSESRNLTHGDITLPVLNYPSVFSVAVPHDLTSFRHVSSALSLEPDVILSDRQLSIARSRYRSLPGDLNVSVYQ